MQPLSPAPFRRRSLALSGVDPPIVIMMMMGIILITINIAMNIIIIITFIDVYYFHKTSINNNDFWQ